MYFAVDEQCPLRQRLQQSTRNAFQDRRIATEPRVCGPEWRGGLTPLRFLIVV